MYGSRDFSLEVLIISLIVCNNINYISKLGTNNKAIVFQRLLWKESIEAIKDSPRHSNYEDFRKHLEESLPQNSAYTRKRYSSSILKWFFPNQKLDSLVSRVWQAYQDELLLTDIMRYQYLSSEPIIARFVVDYIIPLEPGTKLPENYIKDYIENVFKEHKKDSINYLSSAIRDLGLIKRNRSVSVIQSLPLPKTAFFILAHHIFGLQTCTISLKEILENSFWKFLGMRMEHEVKDILKMADSKGFLAKYIIADQLEQVTTKYSFPELLEKKIKL